MQRRCVLKTSVAALAAGFTAPLFAQNPVGGLSDMAVLRKTLALHPGLYRYLSSAQVERGLTSLAKDWAARPAQDARYLALSRFLATIRCGHSYGNFFNQTDAVAEALFDRPTRLPFHFVWLGDEMVVTRGFATGFPPGTTVEAIDGTAPVTLRRRLQPLVRTDGHNEDKRISLLEVRGDDRIETFDVFQGLIAPPTMSEFAIKVRLPDGQRRALAVPAIGLAARRAQMAAGAASKAEPQWQWTMRPDGIAVLTMPGWAVWDGEWDWKSWLGDRLDSLDAANGLIVDIRDNEGGADCGDVILARMIEKDYVPARLEQRLRFRRTPDHLNRYLDTWDDSFRTLGVNARELGNGFFLRPGGEDALSIAPSGKRIRCPMRVLTSPVNSSATFQFAGNVRALGVGKLVGRSTGGNRRGINGGCFFFVRLPESGLEFDLPLVGYFPEDPQPDAGYRPDIEAVQTAAAIAAGRDLVLEAAIASIA